MNYGNIVLLTPKNDEESLMIVKIAEAAGIPTLVSKQPHGAKLEREEDIVERVWATNPTVTKLVIVEIPGVETETSLRATGLEIEIIDHHRYSDLDRMQPTSSLEQFLAKFVITDEQLRELGFDPEMVRGVGIIDRGFLWALREEVQDRELAKRMRDFYRGLNLELGKEHKDIDEVASKAWAEREERPGVLIVKTEREDVPFRDAISFLTADHYDVPPQIVVVEGKRRMFVQESDYAVELFKIYGGFTFGCDRCWGVQAKPEKPLPELEEILGRIA
ncbi:TPA: hypothetical protein DEP96_00810 [Candidatus Uhrbacteria bacterium]|nr:hypothetical protein [Candidatus Uhrbacteria bacterium]